MNTRHVALAVVALAVAATAGADNGWPREIASDRGTLVIYQPQIDRIKQRIVEGRAAVSFAATGTDEPIFGAFWFKAFLETDLDRRMATLASIQVPRVRFPGVTEEKSTQAGAFLEQEILKLNIPISFDRISAVQEELVEESRSAAAFKHDPPRIVIAHEPTVLLLFDGTPVLRDIDGHAGVYQRVVNTPMPVVLDAKGKRYYLLGGEAWYAARDPLGPWSPTADVPAALVAMKAEADRQRVQEEQGKAAVGASTDAPPATAAPAKAAKGAAKPPKVLVATESTELIVVFGEPTWAAVEGTGLQYVSNTQGNILRDTAAPKVYVLLSGRWYAAPSLEGPWAFVPPDTLPRAFARIPDDSPASSVLASVPGTSAARDALLDAQIPQTAAIRRDAASPEVTYDGEPEFKAIEGTSLHYAVNTSFSVIRVGERYYCCHQAVWYAATSPQGPWQVADQVPDDVYTIPPSNPHYNTTYVHVYDATPDVVYTGYYPGYVNSYVYGGCVVYGTGWYYPPYVGPRFYYPWYPPGG